MNTNTQATQELAAAPRTWQRSARAIFAGSVGNAVEWFDWSVYTAFAIYFSKQFFPADNDTASLLATFAVFAVGFGMRPLGGWAIGAFSDRFGRRSALTITIVMMAGSSLLISFLPTYRTIGVLAPIVMTVLRMLQGLSVGGEYGAATTFLAESAPAGRRGFHGSFLFFSIAAGLLLASALAWGMTHFMSRAALEDYGWRIPFFIGGCGSLLGFWMRRNVPETVAFEKLRRKGRIEPRSLLWTWNHHRGAVLRLVGISVLGAFSFYLFISFMPIYAIRHAGAIPGDAFAASTASIAIFMIAQPFFGALSDRIGRRPQLIAFAAAYLVFLYPVVTSIGPGFQSMLLVECFGLLTYGFYSAIAPSIMAELFSTDVRGVGIGAAYNLVVALLGGTTPYLMTWLQSIHREGWFLAYVCAGAAVSLITYWRMPETRGIELE
ncbi:sugar (and other) transporter family protein [Paraburkholderia xenovorans LB400]|uniref:Major facilitator superfamily (MFS)metabolite/H+ symporter n=1 Tax=Paraburkholderia xenovorans (strain LB400) TaxID=266265 RepID=Q13IG0_PARXL|nr:MFS transporter [Paraburkholderia xenovorans]ABE36129.1 major facilitator superfamily (MFS)metabolite/H+ symporter [Paraburkholderia xenovorans LB400]AIP34147.1 sugar (and other) transporter family protein [Paraburkholderia xenovorans LB400]